MDLSSVKMNMDNMSIDEKMKYYGVENKPIDFKTYRDDYFKDKNKEEAYKTPKFSVGGFRAQDFENVFGLSSVDEDQAYSKGSTTGTKQVGGLGTYLTEDDFKRNRNSDKIWKAYAAIYGEDAARDKREGNPDGLSINALDALYDKLAANVEKPAEEVKKTPQYYRSEDSARQAAAAKSYRANILPNAGSILFGSKSKGLTADEANDYYQTKYQQDIETNLKNDPLFDYDSYIKKQLEPQGVMDAEKGVNRFDLARKKYNF